VAAQHTLQVDAPSDEVPLVRRGDTPPHPAARRGQQGNHSSFEAQRPSGVEPEPDSLGEQEPQGEDDEPIQLVYQEQHIGISGPRQQPGREEREDGQLNRQQNRGRQQLVERSQPIRKPVGQQQNRQPQAAERQPARQQSVERQVPRQQPAEQYQPAKQLVEQPERRGQAVEPKLQRPVSPKKQQQSGGWNIPTPNVRLPQHSSQIIRKLSSFLLFSVS